MSEFNADEWIKENLPSAPDNNLDPIKAEGSDDERFDPDALLASMLPPPMPPDPLLTEIAAELGGGGDDAALVEAQAQAGAAVPIRMAGQLCMA